MTTKGQVTVPKAVRDSLGLRPGDKLEFVEDDGSFRVTKLCDAERFGHWRGYLRDFAGQDPDALIEEWRGR
jgi:AbrB family looped-hinge helix DNA binding protein